MGRGKGDPTSWIAHLSTRQILFEMDSVTLPNVRQSATLPVHKLYSPTKIAQWS
ncbi:60S ribosomal protein l16 mitochondrial [Phtheirospermum japonicum]|uniref:60S ribosomal protein l16 mitochondrial n=1 Tax=Phtheirospermum japonicum TaxID=374723 RepID=A0A830BKB9_9LAMI|nr:60S ribosomal protein l16 mitochondrial [Phtheirospermum japonicum]